MLLEIYSIARQKKIITKRRNVHRDRFMDGGGERGNLNNQTMFYGSRAAREKLLIAPEDGTKSVREKWNKLTSKRYLKSRIRNGSVK